MLRWRFVTFVFLIAFAPWLALAGFFVYSIIADGLGVKRPNGYNDPAVSFFLNLGLFGWLLSFPVAIVVLVIGRRRLGTPTKMTSTPS